MRIHLLSDLHLEFHPFIPAVSNADVVILAGDINVKNRGISWAKEVFAGPVLYVPGNHEFYSGHLDRTLEKMRLASDDRVQVMDLNEIVIQNVRFLGATMWTDFSATGFPSIASLNAQHSMNDFKQIRTDAYRRIKPSDLIQRSLRTRDWLRDRLALPHDGPTVVITHHAPSLRSLRDNPNAGGPLDSAYANSWEDMMGLNQIALWVHGHSHTAVDYEVAGTRVVCNPRGYPGEDTGFNASLVLSL